MKDRAPFHLRPLGSTGLLVHPLCVGGSPIADMPMSYGYAPGEERALATLRAVFAGPINFLDTAAGYGDGTSERRIGAVLREIGGLPEGFVVATKCDRHAQTGDFSADQVRRSVERSLRLLGFERLPLCYLHDPECVGFEAAMASGGAVEGLVRARDEGLVENIGIAGGPLPMMTRFVETDLFAVALSHNRYTLLNVSADAFWDTCATHRVAAVNGAPYGSGMLARGPSEFPRYAYRSVSGDILDRAFRLEAICARHNVPLAAAALQFSLRDPRIVSTVVGFSRPERVEQTVAHAQYPIPYDLWAELKTVPPTLEDPQA